MNKSKCVLFDDTNKRLTHFPIKFPEIRDQYLKQRASFWTPESIDFSEDKKDWNSLNNDEKHFIKNILAFFAASDGIVNLNLDLNFSQEICMEEAKIVYRYQSMMEDIHSETYSMMIDIYIKDEMEKTRLFNAMYEIPCVKKKADWALKWINHDNVLYTLRLIAFAIVEGIFFSGSFCAIYWLKHRNLMPGLTEANEYISRDEGSHTKFACTLYNLFPRDERLDENIVHEIFNEAFEIEKEFIIDSLPCRLIGMNSDQMIEHLKFIADNLLTELNYSRLFGTKETPFTFMETINYDRKTNFFERRVSEYQKPVLNSADNTKTTLVLTDDF